MVQVVHQQQGRAALCQGIAQLGGGGCALGLLVELQVDLVGEALEYCGLCCALDELHMHRRTQHGVGVEQLHGQPGLAHSSGADDGDQAGTATQERLECSELIAAPDEGA